MGDSTELTAEESFYVLTIIAENIPNINSRYKNKYILISQKKWHCISKKHRLIQTHTPILLASIILSFILHNKPDLIQPSGY
jgi:hypothetical protein